MATGAANDELLAQIARLRARLAGDTVEMAPFF